MVSHRHIAIATDTFILVCMLVLSGCSMPPLLAGSCTLGVSTDASDEDAIRAVIGAEGQLVVDQKIDSLMALWADGAQVVNAKNTPTEPGDDQYWRDKDAIRHRYVRTVFPGAPKEAVPADLTLLIDGKRAEVRSTTHIGDEVSPGGDRWVLVKQGRCWLIESLTYNLEPKQN